MKFMRILVPAVALSAVDIAAAQISFSIDYKGPTIGMPSCGALFPPITEADILTVCVPGGMPANGPLPPPTIVTTGAPGPGGLGLPAYPGCVGHPPGVACGIEVDALSYSTDGPLIPNMPAGSWKFSVDQYATGLPVPAAPNVFSESPAPIAEAACDVFVDLGLPPGVIPCGMFGPFGNTAIVDGNGLAGPSFFGYPGTGLIEPNSRAFGPACALPDAGDNLDALDFGPRGPIVYYSLDAFGPDVCGFPRGGSGPLNGFLPGAVIAKVLAAPAAAVYAAPGVLGLDVFGPGTDDLDAIALFENGVGGYQVSPGPYVWAPMAPFDMLCFSVTATSACIGAPDSRCGIPISPGDILIPPIPGGLSPFPAILIYAENIGLSALRTGGPTNDNLDALDVGRTPIFDCNGNGVEDALEIRLGGAADCNNNGRIDGCELTAVNYCTAATTTNGCNATMSAAGLPTASLTCPFSLVASSVEGGQSGIIFYGVTGPNASPWGTGFLCVKAPLERTGVQAAGGTAGLCDGSLVLDFNLWMATHPLAIGQPIFAGEAFWSQAWFRDPPSPKTTNMSDGLSFTLVP